VLAEDLLDQQSLLVRDPLATALEVFFEPLQRRGGDLNGAQGKVV
jgi:hypothetical protein